LRIANAQQFGWWPDSWVRDNGKAPRLEISVEPMERPKATRFSIRFGEECALGRSPRNGAPDALDRLILLSTACKDLHELP